MSSEPAPAPMYEVALSFAGEDREYATALFLALQARDVSAFYDEFVKSEIWGKNLYDFLTELYSSRAQLCVMFLSEAYARKAWTKLERQSAQARALLESREYILPLRLDDTPIPGILPTISHLDLRETSIEEVADLIVQKLRGLRGESHGGESRSSRAYYESLGARIPDGLARFKIGTLDIEFTITLGNVIDATRIGGEQEVWLSEEGRETGLRITDTLLQARRGHYVAVMTIAAGQSIPELVVATMNYTTRRLTLQTDAIRHLAAASIGGAKKAAQTLKGSGKTSFLKALGVAMTVLVLGVSFELSTKIISVLFWISFVLTLVYPHLIEAGLQGGEKKIQNFIADLFGAAPPA